MNPTATANGGTVLTHRVTLDQDRIAEHGVGTLDDLLGVEVLFRTWVGTVLVGTVESFAALGQPYGYPIIRFADGKWARGEATYLDVVDAHVPGA